MKYDVIIIGAGAAGLAAARTLSGAGKRICILEARGRIGGRVHSLHFPDLPVPIELGAEFIHGEGASTFSIVDAAALSAAELPDTHWWSRDGKWELHEDFWSEINRVRGKIREGARDVSFADFLRAHKELSPHTRELARTFVEGYHASHAERISTQVLRAADSEQEQEGGNRQFRILDGQDALIAWLRNGLDPE
nr:FAD-dependent oxidoreductase [Acidobacteriota bacterium]